MQRDTQCACGCGLWTHILSEEGNGKVYVSDHRPANEVPHTWRGLDWHETIQAGDVLCREPRMLYSDLDKEETLPKGCCAIGVQAGWYMQLVVPSYAYRPVRV